MCCTVRVKLMRFSSSTLAWRSTIFPGFGGVSDHVWADSDGDRVDSYGPGFVSPTRTPSVVRGCVEQDFAPCSRHPWDGLGQPIPADLQLSLGAAHNILGLFPQHPPNHSFALLTRDCTCQFSANAGFFILNLTNFLHPTPLSLTTPSELLPYGWTAADLWCAPLVTGIYSLLTHAQPFWGTAHAAIFGWLSSGGEELAPVDYETARAACTVVLMVIFSARAVNNYGGRKH